MLHSGGRSGYCSENLYSTLRDALGCFLLMRNKVVDAFGATIVMMRFIIAKPTCWQKLGEYHR